jgi:hypothetical protein
LRLPQALLAVGHRAYLAGQANFPEHHEVPRQWPVADARNSSQQCGQVGGRLHDAHTTDDIDEHIIRMGCDPAVPVQCREQQREPVLLQAYGNAPGRSPLP